MTASQEGANGEMMPVQQTDATLVPQTITYKIIKQIVSNQYYQKGMNADIKMSIGMKRVYIKNKKKHDPKCHNTIH